MTLGTIESKGTRLFFAARATSPGEIIKVACPTAITGLGGSRNQIDITCLDSEEMEFKGGMPNPSPVSVPINLIPGSLAHQVLHDLQESGETIDWMIVLSDEPDDPTATSTVDGYVQITSPGPTSIGFRGYVADLNLDINVNEIVRGTVTIQRTGPKRYDWPTPTLP